MVVAVVVLGAVAQIAAWWLVAAGRATVWTAVAPVIAFSGVVAVAVAPPPLSGRVPVAAAVLAGLGTGVALYLATWAFVAVVTPRWPAFARHARTIYRRGETGVGASTGVAVAVAAGVAVAEELFWRGLTQRELAARLDAALAGALAAWIAYVLVNAPSRNLGIVAGAVVGGAVWAALAWWSAGVLASVLAHASWTALMLLRPAVAEAA
jgi:CAAX protease family protein